MVDLDETSILLAAFVVLLVPFPLISYGTMEGIQLLWWLGIALLVLGGLVPPVSRYVIEDEEDEDDGDEGDQGGDADQGDGEGNAMNGDGDEDTERGRG